MTDLPGPALLFCPADRPDRFAKALDRSDAVIIDLEDAVAPGAKDPARATVLDALPTLDRARTIVRVNAFGTAWHDADVAAFRRADIAAVMLPKTTSAESVEALAPHRVIAICETAAGVLAAPAIARATNCVALMWGGEDLIADIGGRTSRTPDGRLRDVVAQARVTVLLAAAAAGRAAIDSILLDIDDLETLAAEAEDAAASGFQAKACIHPDQVDAVRRAFAPSPTEVVWASGILDAAEGRRGVFVHGGRMVDEPVLRHARAILAAAGREGR